MFLNYVNSDDIFGQINVNRLIYRTSTLVFYVYTMSFLSVCVFVSGGEVLYIHQNCEEMYMYRDRKEYATLLYAVIHVVGTIPMNGGD